MAIPSAYSDFRSLATRRQLVSRPDTDNRDLEISKLRRRLEREQHTRFEAERIAERGLRELYDRQQQLQLLEKIAVAANESSSLSDTLQLALALVCQFTGWILGHAYISEAVDGEILLVSAALWHGTTAEHLQDFKRMSENSHFKAGTGLPGRVLATGCPEWIEDVWGDDNFLRREAASAIGIKGACAFPVLVGSEIVAVIEFFSDQTVEPSELLLQLMSQIGTQVGRVVERKRAGDQLVAAQRLQFELDRQLLVSQAEDTLSEQNARLDAALSNMPHGLCMFDADKCLVICNAQYAEMYKLPADLLKAGRRWKGSSPTGSRSATRLSMFPTT
jgi:PAS domain-containing protein